MDVLTKPATLFAPPSLGRPSLPLAQTGTGSMGDRFEAGTGQTTLPSYKTMLAATTSKKTFTAYKSGSADALAALQKNDYAKAESSLAGLSPADRLKSMENLRKSHPKAYDAMLDGIRSGQIKSQEVTMPAAIDRLEGTQWAQSGEGKKVVDLLQQKYTSNPPGIQFGTVKGGEAKASPANPNGGKNGVKTEASITVDPKWVSSPEGMAATLAHEGQHALRYREGRVKSDLYEETDAHMTEAAVWKEFDNKKYLSVDMLRNPGQAPWDKTAKYYDPNNPTENGAMMNQVAADYAVGYRNLANDAGSAEGKASFMKRATDIMDAYFFENANQGGKLVEKGDFTQLAMMDMAAKGIEPTLDAENREIFGGANNMGAVRKRMNELAVAEGNR